LAEALDILGNGGLEAWIELKSLPEDRDGALLEAIDASPRPDLCRVHSFDHRIIARLGGQRPALPRGILSASYPVNPVAQLTAAGASVLWQQWHLIDDDLVTAVRAAGAEVIAWTVNEEAAADRLARMGVFGLCTDRAVRLMARELGS
jgi:glycerophosphoryl diester phosphodiesterase